MHSRWSTRVRKNNVCLCWEGAVRPVIYWFDGDIWTKIGIEQMCLLCMATYEKGKGSTSRVQVLNRQRSNLVFWLRRHNLT